MTRVTIYCPGCGRSHETSRESVGEKVVCASCQKTFTVELDSTMAPLRPKSPRSPSGKAHQGHASRRASRSLPASAPKRIGKYEVRGFLGAGAMGEVYRAWDPLLARTVAIKLLPREFLRDRVRVKRFQSEARAAASLSHTNVVSVFQIGQEQGRLYIAMQYVDGPALDKAISQSTAMDWREATRAIRDAAAGLEAAHKRGIVHRDVKPANLIRDDDGTIRVADFGLAKVLAANHNVTQEGAVLGTPAFMAPEQWLNERVDHRSDLYALVLTYYYLLTGVTPFEASESMALRYQHFQVLIPDPRRRNSTLPDGVCQALLRGSQKAPEARYQSAGELIAALDVILVKEDGQHVFGTPWEELVSNCESALATLADEPSEGKTRHGRWPLSIQRWGHLFRSKPSDWKWVAAALLGFFGLLALGIALLIPKGHGTAPGSTELKAIQAMVESSGFEDPDEAPVAELRDDLLAIYRNRYGTSDAIESACLMQQLPWPTDALLAENIDPYEWKMAGGGDAAGPPAELVAVIGDSRLKHWGQSWSVAISPKGGIIASGGHDALIRLWDSSTGKQIGTCRGHTGPIRCVTFSPDGKMLASCGVDRTVRIWDTETRKQLRKLNGHLGIVHEVSFSWDGRILVSCGQSPALNIWDLSTGNKPVEPDDSGPLSEHLQKVTTASFHPAEAILATAGSEGSVVLWKMSQGQNRVLGSDSVIHRFEETTNHFRSLQFNPDGTLLAGSHDTEMIVWDVASRKVRQRLKGKAWAATSIAFSLDSQRLAAACMDGGLRIWNLARGRAERPDELLVTPYHNRSLRSVAFGRDGSTLISTGSEGSVRIWDLDSWDQLLPNRGHSATIREAAISVDACTLLSASVDGEFLTWDVPGRILQNRLTDIYYLPRVTAINLAGDRFVTGSHMSSQAIRLWKRNGVPAGAFTGFRADWAKFDSTGQTLVSSGPEDGIRVLDVETLTETRRFAPGEVFRASADLAADDLTIAAVNQENGEIQLFEIDSGKPAEILGKHGGRWHRVRFSPDTGYLVTASDDESVQFWDLSDRKLIDTVFLHESMITALAFRFDGRVLATADASGTIHLWNPENATHLRRLRIGADHARIRQIAFDPSGRHLITANENGTFYILRLSTYSPRMTPSDDVYASVGSSQHADDADAIGEVHRFEGHTGAVFDVAFSDTGKHLLSASGDGTVRLWSVEDRRLLQVTRHGNWLHHISFLPDQHKAMILPGTPSLSIINPFQGKVIRQLRLSHYPRAACLLDEGKAVRTASVNACTIQTVEMASGKTISERTLTTDFRLCRPVFSRDGSHVYTADPSDTVCRKDCQSGEIVDVIGKHPGAACFALSQDEKHLLSGGDDGVVRLWNLKSKELIHELKGHADWVYSVDISHDSRRAISASGPTVRVFEDRRKFTWVKAHEFAVRLWDLDSGTELHCFRGHDEGGGIFRVVFSPDGRYAASASWDHTVRLWRLPQNNTN